MGCLISAGGRRSVHCHAAAARPMPRKGLNPKKGSSTEMRAPATGPGCRLAASLLPGPEAATSRQSETAGSVRSPKTVGIQTTMRAIATAVVRPAGEVWHIEDLGPQAGGTNRRLLFRSPRASNPWGRQPVCSYGQPSANQHGTWKAWTRALLLVD